MKASTIRREANGREVNYGYDTDTSLTYEFFYTNIVENFNIDNFESDKYNVLKYTINNMEYVIFNRIFNRNPDIFFLNQRGHRGDCSPEQDRFFYNFLKEKDDLIFKIYSSISSLKLSEDKRKELTKELYKKNGKVKKLSEEEKIYYRLKYS